MNKIILLLLSLVAGGCYTTMTSVFSSYDLKPRGRVERQPDYLSEERPYLALRDNLLISFNNVPGRSIKPNLETCEQSLDDVQNGVRSCPLPRSLRDKFISCFL